MSYERDYSSGREEREGGRGDGNDAPVASSHDGGASGGDRAPVVRSMEKPGKGKMCM